LSSLTPPPSQRHPDSPFQPIQFGSAATSVTSPPSAVSISQGSQVDTEALGRFFAAQNPEVLQQLLQFVYSNVTPTPK
jgi:ABC-type thiamine transport system substrate-binding protein